MSGVIEVPGHSLIVPPSGIYECLPGNAVKDPGLEGVVERISEGLNPFDYHSSQVCLARQTAYSVIDDETFASREALAIARQMRGRMFSRLPRKRYTRDEIRAVAKSRFEQRVATTIACTMAQISYGNAMFALAFFEPNLGVKESLRLAEAQIDRVDLCQLQVYNTLLASRVTDAYIENVAGRAERILAGHGKV